MAWQWSVSAFAASAASAVVAVVAAVASALEEVEMAVDPGLAESRSAQSRRAQCGHPNQCLGQVPRFLGQLGLLQFQPQCMAG